MPSTFNILLLLPKTVEAAAPKIDVKELFEYKLFK